MKKRKHKKSLLKKLIWIVFLICLFLGVRTVIRQHFPDYKIIKKDTNSNYAGIGQKKIKHQDGYFTTFTTEENHPKTYLEYKQNGTSSWRKPCLLGRNHGRKWLWYYCTFNYT